MKQCQNMIKLMNAIVLIAALSSCQKQPVMNAGKTDNKAKQVTTNKSGADMNNANTARSGDIAIQEEFDNAIAGGNRELIERFIKRHPKHPLAAKAKNILLKKSN